MSSTLEQNLFKRRAPKPKSSQKSQPKENLPPKKRTDTQQYRLQRTVPDHKKMPAVIEISTPVGYPECICFRKKLYISCLNLHCDWSATAGRERKKCPLHPTTAFLSDFACCPVCMARVKEYPRRLPQFEYSDSEDDQDSSFEVSDV